MKIFNMEGFNKKLNSNLCIYNLKKISLEFSYILQLLDTYDEKHYRSN